MPLPQERPAAACFLVSACGPDGWALESNLSPPSSACCLLQEALCAVLLAFVTSSSGIDGSPTLFKQSCSSTRRRDPIHLVLPILVVGLEGEQHRFGERTIPWGHLCLPPSASEGLTWVPVGSCLKLSVIGTPDKHWSVHCIITEGPDSHNPHGLLTMSELKPSVSVSVAIAPQP